MCYNGTIIRKLLCKACVDTAWFVWEFYMKLFDSEGITMLLSARMRQYQSLSKQKVVEWMRRREKNLPV